ncbi:MAG: OmpA family protein [Bacteroidetes bacterium]|nr:OmpA family protein [Bacteroidota bacterium]
MSKVLSILVIVLLFSGVSLAQEERQRYEQDKPYDADFSRPQAFGFGLTLSLNRFAGDLQDGTNFPGAETDWKIGVGAHALWRFADAGDFATLHLLGRLMFSPVASEHSSERYSFTYTDNLFHIIATMQMQLFPEYDLRPYGYAGFGYLLFDPTITGDARFFGARDQRFEEASGSLTLPLGLGLAWTISKRLDFFAEYMKTLTFSDAMDTWVSEDNDNYNMINFGLTFYLGEREEAVQPEAPVPPRPKDTDGDGLLDEDETSIYNTDPNNRDTDGDGLIDGEEVNRYKTDPTLRDTDYDRLLDGEEVNTHKTDPLVKDTDQDGCSDGDEVLDMNTNPLVVDTDGDELNDCDEKNVYRTNPLVKDTDGDGADDGKEIRDGTDPLTADVLRIEESGEIVLEGINFETNSAQITEDSQPVLRKALNTLRTNPDIRVEIQGHTDDVGSNTANQRLSERRASSVRDWMMQNGIDGTRMTARGYGEESPLVPNDSPENRSKNRRITFRIIQ